MFVTTVADNEFKLGVAKVNSLFITLVKVLAPTLVTTPPPDL